MQIQIAPAPRPVTSRRHSALLASGLSALFMAACGGGGGSTTTAPQPPASSVTVAAAVTAADTGTAISGATISVATGTGSVALTLNADGSYTLDAVTRQLIINSGSASVAVTVSQGTTYVPESKSITTKDLALGSTVNIGSVTLTKAADTDLIPADGQALIRLGDGNTSGTSNEKLQTPKTEITGATKLIKMGAIDSLLAANYANVTLSITFRGLDVTLYSCQDTVSLFQTTNASGTADAYGKITLTASTTPVLVNSPADGSTMESSFLLPTASFLSGKGDLWVEITSGSCGSNGIDDFEFYNVRASFSK